MLFELLSAWPDPSSTYRMEYWITEEYMLGA